MAYLEIESLGIPRVRAELAVSNIDHNIIQTDFKNADDHRFLISAASKYGVMPWVSGKDRILKFFGPGVAAMDRAARGTLANMSVDMECTACVIPPDDVTRRYLAMGGLEALVKAGARICEAAYTRPTPSTPASCP